MDLEKMKRVHWVPLESNPDMLTDFAQKVGLPDGFEFVDTLTKPPFFPSLSLGTWPWWQMASPGPGARDARSPRTSPRTSPRSDAGRTGVPSRVQAPAEASIPASSFWAPPNRSRTSSTATTKRTTSRSPRASPPSPTAEVAISAAAKEPTTKAWVRLLDKVSAVLEAEDRNKAKPAAGAEESVDVGQPVPPSEPKSFPTSPDAVEPPDVGPCMTSQTPSLARTSQESESSLPATSVEVIELTLHCQQSGAATDDVNSNASTSVAAGAFRQYQAP
eukprot:s1419_g7.t1